jgi:hypothetical protein
MQIFKILLNYFQLLASKNLKYGKVIPLVQKLCVKFVRMKIYIRSLKQQDIWLRK